MSKMIERIIAVFVVIIMVIIITVILLGTTSYKPKWEITKSDVKAIKEVNFDTDVDSLYSLDVGSVNISLGQELDISNYSLIKDYEYKGKAAKHLLAPSKRYEVLAVSENNKWNIYALRSTNPGVSTPNGYEITASRNSMDSNVEKGKTVKLEDGNKTINLLFVADILCEIYISYI